MVRQVITNQLLETYMSGTITCHISDPLAIFMGAWKCRVKRSSTKVRLSCQSINMHTFKNFRCEILNWELSDMYHETDRNKDYNQFLNTFKKYIRTRPPYAPKD